MSGNNRTPDTSSRPNRTVPAAATIVCALVFISVWVGRDTFYHVFDSDDYLVYHLVVEFASIVVSFAIFTVGWFGYKQRPDIRILALALTFFIVGAIDFIHALAFKGMPAFLTINTVDKAAAYWIAARLIAALGLLVIPFLPSRRLPAWLRPRLLFLIAAALVAGLALLVSYTTVMPAMFIEGEGLTPLKTGLEYLVIGMNVAAIVVLWRRPVFGPSATALLQAALAVGIFSELSFTLYASAYDTFNFMGHVFKAAAYYLILRAVFVSSLQLPYLELNRAREDLERSFESIGQALSSSLDLNKTLDLIARLASDLLNSPYALVALQQREPDSLTVLSTRGIKDTPTVIPLKDNLAAKVWRDHEPVWIDQIDESSQPYPSVMGGSDLRSALAAPILKDDTILGELAVYSREAGAFKEPEARLLAAFARQAAVAIENARLYQSELSAKSRIEGYVTQLSILHEIGLSLNRETDRNRLLKTVLESAAELTGAGAGIMTLIKEGRTEVISEYYAHWYTNRCDISGRPETLHQRVVRLAANGDSTRLADVDGLDMLPVGHIQLRGLLIGTLRDMRGSVTGHFMLSDKRGGEAFTSEDEDVISLLAAQSSVALVSAESFAKEHLVAEALQSALLPGVPDRGDVEVGLLYRSSGQHGKVGGDFYDFIDLDKNRMAVVVGDVCGKGLEAATYTAMIKYMLRAYLSEGLLPGDCLTKLNVAVHDQLPLEKFITAGIAVIDTAANVITYSSAGHPPPCVCRDFEADIMHTPQSVPLGVLPDTSYMSTQISSEDTCSIFMFSDGLIEARPQDGEPFGQERLLQALTGRCCSPAQDVVSDVLDQAIEYSNGELRDDVAMVMVRLIRESENRHKAK